MTFSTACTLSLVVLFQIFYLPLNSLDCDDESVCQSGVLFDTNHVRCRGFNACRYSTTITSNGSYVQCDGFRGCQDSGAIVAATYAICRSAYSCMDATSVTASSYVQCSSLSSCRNTTFITAQSSYVLCYSYQSCDSVNTIGISAGTFIYCRGYQSCRYSKLILSNNGVKCEGTLSCQYSWIEGIETITAYGLSALNYANITSTNTPNNNMTINLYGFEAGNGLRITCDPNHICIINCAGNGCSGTELISGFGTFIVNCDESMNIDCPIGYYGPTNQPTFVPTIIPSPYPIQNPTDTPTEAPTRVPTDNPTKQPTKNPTEAPTRVPTDIPTPFPTNSPTTIPTIMPTNPPSMEPISIITMPKTSAITNTDCDCVSDDGLSDNSLSNDTITESFGNIGLWIIIITIIIIFILITILVAQQTHIKGIKTQLELTKKMLLSEQSEMMKALTKSYGPNGAINIASINGMNTDSIIPQKPAQHANLIQQWANTNAISQHQQQQPSFENVNSASNIPSVIPGQIEMSTLDDQKRYHQEMVNALNRVSSANKFEHNIDNVNMNEGGIIGKMVLPDAPKINNNAIISPNDHNYDNVEILYSNTDGMNKQGE